MSAPNKDEVAFAEQLWEEQELKRRLAEKRRENELEELERRDILTKKKEDIIGPKNPSVK